MDFAHQISENGMPQGVAVKRNFICRQDREIKRLLNRAGNHLVKGLTNSVEDGSTSENLRRRRERWLGIDSIH
jgi:hypothetical protein